MPHVVTAPQCHARSASRPVQPPAEIGAVLYVVSFGVESYLTLAYYQIALRPDYIKTPHQPNRMNVISLPPRRQPHFLRHLFPPTEFLDPLLLRKPVQVRGRAAMPEHFIQRIPDMCTVEPFAFLADDHLRDRLCLRRQPERLLQFFGLHLAEAVRVDDVEQAAPDRSLVLVVGQVAVAFQLRFAKTTHVAEE